MGSYEDTQEANAAEQKDAEFEAQSAKNADVRARDEQQQIVSSLARLDEIKRDDWNTPNEEAPVDAAKLDEEGMARAAEVSQWFIGDPSWADMIVAAYLAETDAWREAHEGINE